MAPTNIYVPGVAAIGKNRRRLFFPGSGGGGGSPSLPWAAQTKTSNLRGSMVNPGCGWRSVMPFPDATIGSGDRATVARAYGNYWPQLVGTRGQQAPTTVRTVTSANIKRAFRINQYFGTDCDDIRIAFTGYGGQSSPTGNDRTIEAAIEYNGTFKQFTFSGANIGTIVNGVAIYFSDPISASAFGLSKFTSQTQYWLRYCHEVADTSKVLPACYVQATFPAGEGGVTMATGVASQVAGTGALVTTGSYTATNDMYVPLGVFGRHLEQGVMTYAGFGDSIMESVSDNKGDPALDVNGWFMRALNALSPKRPYIRMGATGTSAVDMNTVNGIPGVLADKRGQVMFHLTGGTCVSEFNGNEFDSATAAQAYADSITVLKAAKAAGMSRTMQCTLPPRTSSTDTWATPTTSGGTNNQTPNLNFGAGEARVQFNALVNSKVGIDFDVKIDHNAALESPFYPNVTIGATPANTVDGTHQSPQGNTLMKAAFAAVLP